MGNGTITMTGAEYDALASKIATLEAENAKLKGEYEWVASINTALDESNQSAWAENAKLRAELRQWAVDGWKLVPVEPTPEMVSAAEEAHMPFGDMDIALRMATLAAQSAPKADDPVKQMLLEALEFAARSLATMTSADGSGHADIALCVLRMAGYATDERERIVDMWKHDRQWPTDAIAAARKGEGG